MSILKSFILLIVGFILGLAAGWWLSKNFSLFNSANLESNPLLSPLTEQIQEQVLPLNKYRIAELQKYSYQTSPLTIEKELEKESTYTSYLFSYTTMGKKMSGVINVPANIDRNQDPKVIVLLRGYVPQETYTSGTGTRNAAIYFAERGFVTVAPDFFGYGESDPEFEDEWEARFAKPIQVIELLKSIETQGVPLDGTAFQQSPSKNIGIWAHSNGGQIALTTLEILQQPIPTTLWAPVTAPFPYSVLFFSDEEADEGKQARAWVNLLENKYNVLEFSLTQHLNKLTGPLLLHHGTADDAALVSWSDEFVQKVKIENERRENENRRVSSPSAAQLKELPLVDLTYYKYPNADHNLRPVWDTVIARDLAFFREKL